MMGMGHEDRKKIMEGLMRAHFGAKQKARERLADFLERERLHKQIAEDRASDDDDLLVMLDRAFREADALALDVKLARNDYERAEAESRVKECDAMFLRIYACTGRLLARELGEEAP
jgi:hypothetical protein